MAWNDNNLQAIKDFGSSCTNQQHLCVIAGITCKQHRMPPVVYQECAGSIISRGEIWKLIARQELERYAITPPRWKSLARKNVTGVIAADEEDVREGSNQRLCATRVVDVRMGGHDNIGFSYRRRCNRGKDDGLPGVKTGRKARA